MRPPNLESLLLASCRTEAEDKQQRGMVRLDFRMLQGGASDRETWSSEKTGVGIQRWCAYAGAGLQCLGSATKARSRFAKTLVDSKDVHMLRIGLDLDSRASSSIAISCIAHSPTTTRGLS
ncbi:hypothetical protein LIA77_07760 [Sarocladium implicatum]|nr:hypothetical protein LIA77_07760 [Sarocladium implicatum]